jgi:hypothetical protein
MILCRQGIADQGRYHDNFAVCKIKNVGGLDDEYEAQGDQGVETPHGNAAREQLNKE